MAKQKGLFDFLQPPSAANFQFAVQPNTGMDRQVRVLGGDQTTSSPRPVPPRFPGINDPGLITSQFPVDQRPFVSNALSSLGATPQYNQQILDEALAMIMGAPKAGNRRGQTGLIGQVNDAFAGPLQALTNPYSDQLRNDTLASIQDQIARQNQSDLERAAVYFAGRGLTGSGGQLDIENALRNQATQGRVAANLGTLKDQTDVNTQAAATRGQLTAAQQEIIGRLGLGAAGLQAQNAIPLDLGFNANAELLQLLLGQQNAEKALALGAQTAQNNAPNWLTDILQIPSLFFPGSKPLAGLAGTAGLAGNYYNPEYGFLNYN